MHIDHDHSLGGHTHQHVHADGTVHSHEHIHDEEHSHEHPHAHSHTHADGTVHTHEHDHTGDHSHTHTHEEMHAMGIPHEHADACAHDCQTCPSQCEHTPMEELTALMQYMVGHNAAHTRELADLAVQLDKAGDHAAYEQVMAAVSDFEKGNLRLSAVLSALKA